MSAIEASFFSIGAFVGMIIAAFVVCGLYDTRDANRIKLGFMSTSQGLYKLTEIKP
ncbi:hypothetical protein [Rhizobium sp. NZLR11]|uniref:hypothetical protein n=1 Tax=Rhizobium sp. NZLR11 TaxID=2731098 RepID=UPI001C83E0D0|nr:hypothetical protein [Rhizobium sp. NZLR11]MBX5206719.1 hypothetical protein [Rhizobium sp. NZLR11]